MLISLLFTNKDTVKVTILSLLYIYTIIYVYRITLHGDFRPHVVGIT